MEEQKAENEMLEMPHLSPEIEEKMEKFIASLVLEQKLEEQIIDIDENCPLFEIIKKNASFPVDKKKKEHSW